MPTNSAPLRWQPNAATASRKGRPRPPEGKAAQRGSGKPIALRLVVVRGDDDLLHLAVLDACLEQEPSPFRRQAPLTAS